MILSLSGCHRKLEKKHHNDLLANMFRMLVLVISVSMAPMIGSSRLQCGGTWPKKSLWRFHACMSNACLVNTPPLQSPPQAGFLCKLRVMKTYNSQCSTFYTWVNADSNDIPCTYESLSDSLSIPLLGSPSPSPAHCMLPPAPSTFFSLLFELSLTEYLKQ